LRKLTDRDFTVGKLSYRQPGESKAVRLQFGERALAVWSTEQSDWVVNPGTYRILVGTSSDDTPLEAIVMVRD
jgi:beta-glucosidase